jgi:putative flippase GtrA
MSGSRPIIDMEQWIRSLPRVIRFCLAGGLGTGVNLAVMMLLVEGLHMHSFWLKGLANALAMGIGAIAVFFLHRAWTWEDATKRHGYALLRQFFLFAGSLTIGVGCRIALFALFDYYIAIDYLVNVAIGIAGAAIIDYFLYARFVFGKPE